MKRAWLIIGVSVVLVAIILLAAVVLVLQSDYPNQWVYRAVVRGLEQATGARVQLGALHLEVWRLSAELDGLTLRGLEGQGLPTLFHADRVDAGVRIVSFFSRKIVLDHLFVDNLSVFVRINKDGLSNIPTPPKRSNSSFRKRLFDLEIGQLRLEHGNAEFNDVRVPLDLQVHDFHFFMGYAANGTAPVYNGNLEWKGMDFTARRYLPFQSDVSVKFRLAQDAFHLDELRWKLPNSDLQVRADLTSFVQPVWDLHFRGRLSFDDLRVILRKPTVPGGLVDFTGAGQYANGNWTATGHYHASDVALRFQWFHSGGIENWGDFVANPAAILVPQFGSKALEGSLTGRLEFDLRTLNFRVQSRLRGASLAAALTAVDNESFPVRPLHWNGLVNVDSLSTWRADFKHFHVVGTSQWSPPPREKPGEIPASAQIGFDYSMDRNGIVLSTSEISTPQMQLNFSGAIHKFHSALDVHFQTTNLLVWDDFIDAIRGPNSHHQRISGQATWVGRLEGPIVAPTFSGQVHVLNGKYGQLSWDEVEGDMEYSPDELRLTHMNARHGKSAVATLDLWLQFDGAWDFLPSSQWTLDAVTYRAPVDQLQDFFALHYPVSGIASGDVKASGTRASPTYEANFIIDKGEARGFRFDRFSGQFGMQDDEIRISHAELQKNPGRMTGDLAYHPQADQVSFHVAAADIPLENIQKLQTPSLPIGGRLTFDLHGEGPLLSPIGDGTLQLTKLKVGKEEEGDFLGQLNSDGRSLSLKIDSLLTKGKLNGQIAVQLGAGLPVSGEVDVNQFDLDPLITAGLHLKELTGHSSVDGKFRLSGDLRQPDTLDADAALSRVSLDYEYVKLQNEGPVRLSYQRNEVRIEQAQFQGPATDFTVSGSARFDGDRPMDMKLSGSVNLQLAAGFIPGLTSNGASQLDVALQGTLLRPRITGRASFAGASVRYGDFPTGLSNLNGQFLFTRNRLLFDKVTAQAGGGLVTLGGSLTYGDLPVQYEVNVVAPHVLIRYPTGISWSVGGKMQLTGTSKGGLLSGAVQLDRLLLAQGVDLPTLFGSQEATSAAVVSETSSSYLQNLQFDIGARTTPNARLEWPNAHVEIDGDVRLRGTWDRPLLLGQVHLLSGEMAFRGNSYRLTRGDVNFSNPFRLDPVLNVEATANISQYQVTVDFTGAASRLNLSYRSDPPLPDSDIVSLLAIGTPGEESALRSSTSGSQNYGATALLSEAISSQLGGRIEHLFGITNFRVDPFLSGTTTEANTAARVTVEKQVTRDLVVTYSTNANTTEYQVIQVEYSVRRDISVVFLRDINDTYSFTVEFKKHFK